jgi:hypothetical protein
MGEPSSITSGKNGRITDIEPVRALLRHLGLRSQAEAMTSAKATGAVSKRGIAALLIVEGKHQLAAIADWDDMETATVVHAQPSLARLDEIAEASRRRESSRE